MKVLLSWINDFVEISDIPLADLTAALTNSGFEVEEVIDKAKGLEKVVSAKIEKIERHPNADKLVICKANIGSKTLQIVTGATNMKEGDIVALAQDGADLPCGVSIKSGQIRGQASEGMFCGGDELGIDNSVYEGAETYGLLILKQEVAPGLPMAQVLGLNEVILDVNVLPNRPDCNSIIGVAREIAALFNKPLKPLSLDYKTQKTNTDINISIKDYEKCSRYIGVVIEDIKNLQTPDWMKKRLSLLGHGLHGLFVDITNYILLEIGQPMHVFDTSKIKGNKIIVRTGKDGEQIKLLDEKIYNLSSNNLVIADSERALAVAGVMGGEESGTYPETKNVLFESATFNYANIRRTANALGINSDASVRFSKGVYFDSADLAMKRALHIIDKLNAGKISEKYVDVYSSKPEKVIVKGNVCNINERLSLNVSAEEMVKILNSLQIKTINKNGTLITEVPSFRTDIERECDLCEEIGRIYGLDKINTDNITLKTFNTVGDLTLKQHNINTLKNAAACEGFNEMISYQFISPRLIERLNQNPDEFIKLLNPIGLEYSTMRKSLIPAMLAAIEFNQKQGNKNLYLFELARVFLPKSLPLKELPDEPEFLCLAINAENEDFYSIKDSLNKIVSSLNIKLDYKQSTNEFLHPGIAADIYLYNRKIGVIGKVHPTVLESFEITKDTYIAEINLSQLLSKDSSNRSVVVPSKLPNIERDIALIVSKEVPAANLLATIKKFKNEIEKAVVFDVYEGAQIAGNFKSVAIKLYLKQNEKTLTEQEISAIVNRVLDAELKENGAKLR